MLLKLLNQIKKIVLKIFISTLYYSRRKEYTPIEYITVAHRKKLLSKAIARISVDLIDAIN